MSTSFDIDQLHRATVFDSTGDKVGKVSQVYLDGGGGEPQFVTVSTGLFGTKESFVPLQGASVRDDELHVTYTKDVIKDAPNIDADREVDQSEEDALFRYYSLDGASTGSTGAGAGTTGTTATTGTTGTSGTTAGDLGSDGDLDGDRVANPAGGHHTGDRDDVDDSVVRREEELHVGTERFESGRLRIRKHVVTDHETVTVPVEREEVEVVREPLNGTSSGASLGDDEIDVTLTEERPVVDKRVVDAERVGVDRRTVTDQETVSEDVAKEEIEIDRDGDVRR